VPVKRARHSAANTKTKGSSPKRARLSSTDAKVEAAVRISMELYCLTAQMRAKTMRAIGYGGVDMASIDKESRARINKLCANYEYNEKRKIARRSADGEREYKPAADKRRAKKTSPTKHHVGGHKYSHADRIRQRAIEQQRRIGRPSNVQRPWLASSLQVRIISQFFFAKLDVGKRCIMCRTWWR